MFGRSPERAYRDKETKLIMETCVIEPNSHISRKDQQGLLAKSRNSSDDKVNLHDLIFYIKLETKIILCIRVLTKYHFLNQFTSRGKK